MRLPNLRFFVHSTYRDKQGRKLLPKGLDWDVPGQSHIAYTPARMDSVCFDGNMDHLKLDILAAHNRWSFAKGRSFRQIDDIQHMTKQGRHVLVEWKDKIRRYEETRYDNVLELVQSTDLHDGSGVWINGIYELDLTSETLPRLLKRLDNVESQKLCIKRSDGIIRIERYYAGFIRGQSVFEHTMDNLIAMEDPEVIDERTLIGSAVLWDWIKSGYLLSRLWVQEDERGIRFLRPLIDDDIKTADRRYELAAGFQDDKIALVKHELDRLRHLATLPLPFDLPNESVTIDQTMSERERLHRQNRKRKFSM